MTFKKPNIKYTDMCIYIDDLVAKGEKLTEEQEEKCFVYLYHLVFMLSHKHKYFNKPHYYDEFSLYVAGDMMYRLFYNPKIKELNEDGTTVLVPIKSVLNYLKVILYGRKVSFEQENYSQKISCQEENPVIFSSFSYNNKVNFSSKSILESDIKIYFKSLSKTICEYLKKECIYKKDKVLLKNIQLSCMLSILNFLTHTQETLDNIQNKYVSMEAKFNYLCKIYQTSKQDKVILYHLDDIFEDYITVMVRRLWSVIEYDFKELQLLQNNYLKTSVVPELIFNELNGDIYDKED